MKRFFFLCLLCVVGTFVHLSANVILPSSVNQSQCKDGVDKSRSEEVFPELSGSISYEAGLLTLTINDLMENCCSELTMTADTDGTNEIHFTVSDSTGGLCDCICPFDLTCKYEGILEGTYKVYLEYDRQYVLLSKEIVIEEGCVVPFSKESGMKLFKADGEGLVYRLGGILEVGFEGMSIIEIFGTDGRLVDRTTLHSPSEISLASLPAGIYYVRATNGKKRVSICCIR